MRGGGWGVQEERVEAEIEDRGVGGGGSREADEMKETAVYK